ncbi:hypothetical protein J2Z83_002295 [Virgibacillus natechei]|uniref:Uncharacterized protein n=1 Tax=Virgibacillus natechei TaxID=1216297 RepID=A0ABS4IGV5_9BACI|nr:hypothetical protein [Virgibacillus natechei]MBP1970177.1 hypothetical protein [Virgibacillus natechei]UZD12871.1 hypothetical protein OLD84_18615 [Virgibacillus natechei]
MKDDFISIDKFNTLIHQWNGYTIKITKHELDDRDQTVMELQNISYATNHQRLDDYQPMHVLLLDGRGETETTTNTFQPLPTPTYEIPIQDNSLYEFNGSRFIITTERAVYKIERTTNSGKSTPYFDKYL